jgi:hypothetical protein
MYIQRFEIGNFRKLKAIRVDFATDKTVFVGANNSGKSSAMLALRRFCAVSALPTTGAKALHYSRSLCPSWSAGNHDENGGRALFASFSADLRSIDHAAASRVFDAMMSGGPGAADTRLSRRFGR